MNIGQPGDSGKDKRLLVLLAFGVLLLLFPLSAQKLDGLFRDKGVSWGWVEIGSPSHALYRIRLGDAERGTDIFVPGLDTPLALDTLRRQRAVAVEAGRQITAAVSPRLSLLLGLPFSINRASADELALLPGIGPNLAASIIAYRTRHGRIADEQALVRVPGIGRRLATRLFPLLSFE